MATENNLKDQVESLENQIEKLRAEGVVKFSIRNAQYLLKVFNKKLDSKLESLASDPAIYSKYKEA